MNHLLLAGLCWAGGDSSHRTVLHCTALYCTVHLHPSLQPNIDLVSAGAGPLVWLVLEPGVTTALSTIHSHKTRETVASRISAFFSPRCILLR